MTSDSGLTTSQTRSPSRAAARPSSSSESETNDGSGTTTPTEKAESSTGADRATRHRSHARKLSRKQSLLALKARLTGNVGSSNNVNGAPAQQPLPDGSRSSSPTSRPAPPAPVRRPSLKLSLSKPLPETPSELASELLSVISSEDTSEDVEPPAAAAAEPRMDSRTSTMDSSSSAAAGQIYGGEDQSAQDVNSSVSSLASSIRLEPSGDENSQGQTSRSTGPGGVPAPAVGPGGRASGVPAASSAAAGSSTHLSGLMCNVHRTTGREPPPLVGATTTILGDKLYVFGGRILSRTRPAPLTSDLYELDLISRHWTKLDAGGDVPPPRYFHSMCALGDTKMVCYGGMSPTSNHSQSTISPVQQEQPDISVMSDIHVYDVETRKWTYLPAQDAPQGRYAHCACVLPSSASFFSGRGPLAALQHNPSSANPHEGRIGISIDGSGGAEMVIVGGQDGSNHYIEQISVFNLRSLKWTSTQSLGKSCGAYRSVAAPLPPAMAASLGKTVVANGGHRGDGTSTTSQEPRDWASWMLIYSNYNFLDVKLELQIRSADGTLTEKPMSGTYSPPGLRFPSGGIIETHFVVSGTYLTSSKQEYALWALDLRTLTWSRIDAGGSVFSQGSWNRGILWNRRNTFVILGNRKRSLVDDYNHRRINFSNVCMVELEAFGFYDNPRKTNPMSGFVSASSPYSGPGFSLARKAGCTAGGRQHSRASEELGEKALKLRELADMDILCIGGERIPVNSRFVSRRWGPYFVQLLREGTAMQDGSDSATLRSGSAPNNPFRASAVTIMPGPKDATLPPLPPSSERGSMLSVAVSIPSGPNKGAAALPPVAGQVTAGDTSSQDDDGGGGGGSTSNQGTVNAAPTPRSLPPNARPRCLYLPHTYLTVQALLHFLYTSSLPPPASPLCTPQILCSLLQIARPYRIDGLLEAVVERLHGLLDSRNAAAVFNATAMAAGGGRGIDGSLNPNFFVSTNDPVGSPISVSDFSIGGTGGGGGGGSGITTSDASLIDLAEPIARLSLDTDAHSSVRPKSEDLSAAASVSGSERGSISGTGSERNHRFVWNGELSSVIGLQKRGLRGLMEGRRMRERTGTGTGTGAMAQMGHTSLTAPTPTPPPPASQQGPAAPQQVGLGIASSE